MPRIVNNSVANHERHSSYHTGLLNDSHSVLQTIATNTKSMDVNTDTLEALQTTNNTTLQALDDRIHSFSGHTENTTAIGDGSDQLRTVGLGYDRTNQKVRSILVDSGGKQVVDNPTFDALIGATNNTISAVGDGSNQLRVVPLGYDRTNGKAVSFLVDAAGHQQLDVVSSALPTGGATSANQSTINTTIGTGNTTLSTMNTNVVLTNSKLDTLESSANSLISANHTDLVALEASLTSMESKQDSILAKNTQNEALLTSIKTAVEILDNTVSGNEMQVDIVSGSVSITGSSTEAKQDNQITKLTEIDTAIDTIDSVLDASLVKQTNIETLITTLDGVQDNILTKLTAIDSDTNDIKTAVEILDNAIAGSEMQVDIVSAPTLTVSGTVTANLSATDNAVLDDVAQKLGDIETAVQILDNAISGSEMQVDIVSAPTLTVQGTVTANLSATDNAVLDASLVKQTNIETLITTLDGVQDNILTKLTAIDSDTNDIKTAVEILDNAISGSEMQVDIVSAPTLTVQGTVTANLSATDNAVLDASLVKQTNIETLITTLDGVQDNILTKLTAIDSDTNDIKTAVEILDNAIAGSEMQVDVVAALPAGDNNIGNVDIASSVALTVNLGATDNAVLDDIAQKLGDVETAVQLIDNAISGSEMQVDVVAALPAGDNNIGNVDIASALPAGTNNIGVVTANLSATDNAVLDAIETTNNACQVLLGTIDSDTDAIKTSVQLIDDVVKAEDAAHSSGDKGIMALAVHQTAGTLLGANGDYTPLSVNVNQHLRSAQELQTFAFTLPSSGTIGASNMGETDVFQFHHKVNSFTLFVGSNNTAAFSIGFVVMGSTDGSAFFALSSSLYAGSNFNDNDKMNYATFINFNIKHIKVQVTNNSSSSDTFLVSICA